MGPALGLQCKVAYFSLPHLPMLRIGGERDLSRFLFSFILFLLGRVMGFFLFESPDKFKVLLAFPVLPPKVSAADSGVKPCTGLQLPPRSQGYCSSLFKNLNTDILL